MVTMQCYVPISIALQPCMYLVPFVVKYSASNNGVNVKSGLGVIRDHWKWRRSIDHIRLTIGRPL